MDSHRYVGHATVLLGASCTLLALLGGCASPLAHLHNGESQNYADYAGAPVQEFNSYHLEGWEAVSADRLVLWSSYNRAYLVQVWYSCPNLQFAYGIAVTSTSHTISRLDTVRVNRDRCPISVIQPIDLDKMKADRAAAKASS